MSVRPRSSTRDAFAMNGNDDHVLPIHSNASRPSLLSSLRRTFSIRSLRTKPRSRVYLAMVLLLLFALLNHTTLGTWRRDTVYLLRPLWDTPPQPFMIIPNYAPPLHPSGSEDIDQWCGLHNWTTRHTKPILVDAILFSSEVDLLEIRMREYKGLIDVFVIVESDLTFSGHDKPLHYKQNKEHFERIINGTQSKIVYRHVEGLEKGLKPGSFDNEFKMRQGVSTLLSSLELPIGSLILQSDVDEIISRETLRLLKSCQIPINLHLNVKNYRYDFHFPIPDDGYWRPHISTTTALREGGYSHGRQADLLLEGAGWHCSFCFRTLGEMRGKMLGYSHNDRVRGTGLVKMENIRKRVCEGREPFDMYPESFTFKGLFAQSGRLTPSYDFTHVPLAIREEPDRFGYLLDRGCDRPE